MFQVGDRVKLTTIGEAKYISQSRGGQGTVTHATRGEWTDVRWDNGNSNNYQVEDLYTTVRVPALPKEEPTPTAEQKEVASRVKYLYSVETDETQIMSTRDREYARQVKAYLGGKKEGIIIMAYAPVKEIR